MTPIFEGSGSSFDYVRKPSPNVKEWKLMTEQEWLACNSPLEMLDWLNGVTGSIYGGSVERDRLPSARKLRLIAASFYRLMGFVRGADEWEEPATEAERWADKELSRNPIDSDPLHHAKSACRWVNIYYKDPSRATDAIRDIVGNPFRSVQLPWSRSERANPGCPTFIYYACDWFSRDVQCIAQTMYDSRDFTDMPILADALEDADCNEPAILEHCRSVCEYSCEKCKGHGTLTIYKGPGATNLTFVDCKKCSGMGKLVTPRQHYRGCWVVDLILGKT